MFSTLFLFAHMNTRNAFNIELCNLEMNNSHASLGSYIVILPIGKDWQGGFDINMSTLGFLQHMKSS